eukprot:9257827-Pyramimonas_sp.AAC.1
MSRAERARPPQVRASLSTELRGCLGESWPDFRARHGGAQNSEDVGGENGETTLRATSRSP